MDEARPLALGTDDTSALPVKTSIFWSSGVKTGLVHGRQGGRARRLDRRSRAHVHKKSKRAETPYACFHSRFALAKRNSQWLETVPLLRTSLDSTDRRSADACLRGAMRKCQRFCQDAMP
jgi:hypothetical protein